MIRVVLPVICAASLVACSILTTFDGFSGSSEDSGADAADVVAPADSGNVGYCASLRQPVVFCDDFDGPDAASIVMDRSRAEPRTDDFVSPPRALRIGVDPLDGGNTTAAFSIPLATSPHRLICRFDLKVEAASGFTGLAEMVFVAGKSKGHLGLQVRATGLAVSEFIEYPDGGNDFWLHTETPMTWPSGWMHVELVWTDSFTSSLVVNGARLETEALLHEGWFKGLATVFYGNAFANGVTPSSRVMRIDNLVVDTE